jgi:hypothetical protein
VIAGRSSGLAGRSALPLALCYTENEVIRESEDVSRASNQSYSTIVGDVGGEISAVVMPERETEAT